MVKKTLNTVASGIAVALCASAFMFQSCGKSSTPTATASDSTGYTVKTTDGTAVGTLSFVDWPGLAIRFSDSSIGFFSVGDGKYSSPLCKNSKCNLYTAMSGGVYGWMIATGIRTDIGYCFYSGASCSGTCYLNDAPVAGLIVRNASGSLVQATGSEAASSYSYGSMYRHDIGSCVTTGGTMSGGYAVSNSYSLPAGVPAYPFGQLSFP